MSNLVESINLKAPSGTLRALKELAVREDKKVAQIVREAVQARLSQSQEAA